MSKAPYPPHIRLHGHGEAPHLDLLIALLPLAIFSAVYYGWRPVLVMLCGAVSAFICEAVCCLLMRRRPTFSDCNALYIGTAVGALMSPATSYWVPAIGAAFAIIVVKMPFGGTGRYVFQPVAAGMAFLSQCMSGTLFRYPDSDTVVSLALDPKIEIVSESSLAGLLAGGAVPNVSWSTLLLGNIAGPIGATAIAVLLACMLYLFIRKAVSPHTVLPYLGTCGLLAALFPRVDTVWYISVALELCAGYLLFAAIFLLGDPVTSPRHAGGRIVYGVLAGGLTMLMRHFGRFEDGTAFAILLISVIAPIIDSASWRLFAAIRFRKEVRG